jgi:hypothetical protein
MLQPQLLYSPQLLGARSGKRRIPIGDYRDPTSLSLTFPQSSVVTCTSLISVVHLLSVYLDYFWLSRDSLAYFNCVYPIKQNFSGLRLRDGSELRHRFRQNNKKKQVDGAEKVGPGRELNPGPPPYSARRRNHATRPSGLNVGLTGN